MQLLILIDQQFIKTLYKKVSKYIDKRTSDSLNEGLSIKRTREKFQRK